MACILPLILLSYPAFMILILPIYSNFAFTAIAASLLGMALIWLKREKLKDPPEKDTLYLLPIAVLYAAFLGYFFYLHVLRTGWLMLFVTCLLSAASIPFLFLILYKLRSAFRGMSDRRTFLRYVLYCLTAALATVILTQKMMGIGFLMLGLPNLLFGTLIVFVFIAFLYALTDRLRCSILIPAVLFLILATADRYVLLFRNRLLDPMDIFSIGTAINVASNYSLFPIPGSIIFTWIFFAGSVVLLTRAKIEKGRFLSLKRRLILLAAAAFGTVAVIFYIPGLKIYHWENDGANYNGTILDLFSKFKEAFVSEPETYSPEAVAGIADRYADSEASAPASKPPHIIAIMNEAFSDLSVLGRLATNEAVMPVISSLNDNAVTGYALASVYGGNTANSEFEFLTGTSMAWLSPNAVPYQQYLNTKTPSMVTYLESEYGYRSLAMHPYLSDGWNRPQAYENLGFDEARFLEDFPCKDLERKLVSDREMYDEVIRIYEDQHEDPLFIFGVTIQNHGNYLYEGSNYTQSIYLQGYDNPYPDVEQYLSLIHESDRAVGRLISYFSEAEDDVVIVFFGDHQPSLDENFYSECSDSSYETLDEQQRKYEVPFFIWANYDIDEQSFDCLSLNYLSSHVYEAAGLRLPLYNRFLSDMEKKIPSINANGFYSEETQSFLPFDEASDEEKQWLNDYENLQYNYLFDPDQRNESLFPAEAE